MKKIIGKVAATEKKPTTIDEFYFWTDKHRVLNPFDVIKVEHINESSTFGVIEEISHITDSASFLSNYISSDFGDVSIEPNMHRIGMNFVKAKVLANNQGIYTPVLDGSKVGLAEKNEVRLRDAIKNIQKNDMHVIDIARLDIDSQAFVFGDVIRAIYDLKLGQEERDEKDIPSKIIIFIDELNKYASKDIPKNSPILRQIIDIAERGRSLGIILFSVEQFKSAIHDRVKGNCALDIYKVAA